jgi:hypothetical protein
MVPVAVSLAIIESRAFTVSNWVFEVGCRPFAAKNCASGRVLLCTRRIHSPRRQKHRKTRNFRQRDRTHYSSRRLVAGSETSFADGRHLWHKHQSSNECLCVVTHLCHAGRIVTVRQQRVIVIIGTVIVQTTIRRSETAIKKTRDKKASLFLIIIYTHKYIVRNHTHNVHCSGLYREWRMCLPERYAILQYSTYCIDYDVVGSSGTVHSVSRLTSSTIYARYSRCA